MASQGKSLVIVESPAKARTISDFLPKSFKVEASIGHVRDLPQGAREVPKKYKSEAWARLGVDVDNDFEPLYIVPAEKKKQVQKLKAALKDVDQLYLATDEDREGESISWHLMQVLKPKVPLRRLVFHEITREAILEALDNPRDLDEGLVKAQEARRILDRLFGYEVSPVLWRKIGRQARSAGRTQSVAVRLIVDRERLRRRFVRSSFWDLKATFATRAGEPFDAELVRVGDQRIVASRDFESATGQLKEGGKHHLWLHDDAAERLRGRLETVDWRVDSIEEKPYTSNPSPPFMTSTLQQEANRKLRFPARRTMQVAQRLYENGHITYMRTDSTTLADSAVDSIRGLIADRYGQEFLSQKTRQYQTKVRNAQEAHEAIRPSSVFQRPRDIEASLGPDEFRLYELIWKRTMACQMARARGHHIAVRVKDGVGDADASAVEATFQARGKTIEFPGFLLAYAEGSDDPSAELADQEIVLPRLEQGEELDCRGLEARARSTQPPARFTEASLVKELEAKGIGRPTTYASIIETILAREYVVKRGNALVPSFTAYAVVKLLENFFPDLVDVGFTARMEEALDEISLGTRDPLPYLKGFYFGGDDRQGLHALTQQEIDPKESCTLLVDNDENGDAVNVRVGRYGPYLERGDERASIPDDVSPDELSLEKALEILKKGTEGPRQLGSHPESGEPVYVKVGRFGPYVQLGEPDADEKPKMKSLLPGMSPETVSIEEAVALLALPRPIGNDPESGEEITVDYGRYGPYLRRGKETRSLDVPEQIFTVTVELALAKFKEEKRGRARGPKVLKELGENEAGAAVRLLDGRYGPYVTDGETNASIPRGSDPNEVDLRAAMEMIRAREAMGPRKKKKAAKKKKKTRKKAAKKKVAKKAAANKTAAE
ncbi:MAG: type I DNA topoisomerase [Acidobacteriota bacterium]|nr:type I DNA topoisomerase [Acidobacteriota bacterium]